MGHAKCHIVALDIFTGKKYEDLCPAGHNISVPFVKRTEFQILSADRDSGEVSLPTESGDTRDDLFLPSFRTTGEPNDDQKKLSAQIADLVEKGEKTIMAIVQSACGEEQIIDCKEIA